jgi:hypothetical protein
LLMLANAISGLLDWRSQLDGPRRDLRKPAIVPEDLRSAKRGVASTAKTSVRGNLSCI